MFVKTSEELRESDGAFTLEPSVIGVNDSGWKVKGKIKEDWFEWVNEFEAFHPSYGRVWGDFEVKVFADSEAGFIDFYKNHPPREWCYGDI